jgi:hypothetical protein
MSAPINDGGPAFPRPESRGTSGAITLHGQNGMTLRDYFAGQALTSMTAAPDYSKGPCNGAMAVRAYLIADAMLAAREGKQ